MQSPILNLIKRYHHANGHDIHDLRRSLALYVQYNSGHPVQTYRDIFLYLFIDHNNDSLEHAIDLLAIQPNLARSVMLHLIESGWEIFDSDLDDDYCYAVVRGFGHAHKLSFFDEMNKKVWENIIEQGSEGAIEGAILEFEQHSCPAALEYLHRIYESERPFRNIIRSLAMESIVEIEQEISVTN